MDEEEDQHAWVDEEEDQEQEQHAWVDEEKEQEQEQHAWVDEEEDQDAWVDEDEEEYLQKKNQQWDFCLTIVERKPIAVIFKCNESMVLMAPLKWFPFPKQS